MYVYTPKDISIFTKFTKYFAENAAPTTFYLDIIMIIIILTFSVTPLFLGIFGCIFFHLDHYYYLLGLDAGHHSNLYITTCAAVRFLLLSGFFEHFRILCL